jgi:hypothetical protein
MTRPDQKPPPMDEQEWIEDPRSTAPRDRPILCWNAFFGQYVSQWDGQDFPLGYHDGVFGQWFPVPQFWREQPPSPTTTAEA